MLRYLVNEMLLYVQTGVWGWREEVGGWSEVGRRKLRRARAYLSEVGITVGNDDAKYSGVRSVKGTREAIGRSYCRCWSAVPTVNNGASTFSFGATAGPPRRRQSTGVSSLLLW